MPPKSATSSKPPSRAASKPPSSRAAKPPSTASTKPASSRRPPASTKASTPAIVEDVQMSEEASQPNVDGPKANGHAAAPAVKRGRVGELAGEEKRARRRSSLGVPAKNTVPEPRGANEPHLSLFVWGTGDMGQFGLGPDQLDEIARPKLHTLFEELNEDGKLSRKAGDEGEGGLEKVACGGMHTLAIDEAGRVWSWGINDNAALGRITVDVPDPNNPEAKIPNEDLESTPLVVESLEKAGFRAVEVAAGDSVSVALSDKGELKVWGSFRSNDGVLGFDGVPGHPKLQYLPMSLPSLQKLQFTSISCGSDHVLALTTTGHVYVWGNGQQNQLGRRIIERRKINGLEPERLGLRNIVHVSAGMFHSFAVDSTGRVWAWGLNTFHQTGLSPQKGGDEEMVIVPAQVDALAPEHHQGARVVQIAGGEHHTVFLFDNGEVYACGRCDASQVGIAEDHPAWQGVLERREEIRQGKQKRLDEATKKLEACAPEDKAEREMEVATAQANLQAALDEFVPEPVRVMFPPVPESYESPPTLPAYTDAPTANPIAGISAGTRHNLAVSRSGHVYAWGFGQGAELGLGAADTAKTPTLVRSKTLRPYTSVVASAGGQHCVLLAKKGSPYASG